LGLVDRRAGNRPGRSGKRGTRQALPVVRAVVEVPFVVASRHPNGAISVATLSRTSTEKGIFLPLADVSIAAGDGTKPIGIFDKVRSLTISLTAPLGARRVWAQDLAEDDAVDITDRISHAGKQLVLGGELIDQIGSSAATPGDLSEPGLILAFKEM
jgi:hypothetical protein